MIYVGQLTDQNCLVNFSPNGCAVQDLHTGQVIMKGDKHGHLFHLDLNQKKSPPFCLTVMSSSSTSHVQNTWDFWHRRLESMFKSQLLLDKLIVKNNDFQHCQTRVLGKFAKLPFASSTTKFDAPCDLIYCDLWGPSPILSRLWNKYFFPFY